MKRKLFTSMIAIMTAAILMLSGCVKEQPQTVDKSALIEALKEKNILNDGNETENEVIGEKFDIATKAVEEDFVTNYDTATASVIVCDGDRIQADAKTVAVNGQKATISMAGTYVISGTLNDGQIIVEAKGETVHLILDNVDITCSDSAPINIKKAEKVILTLPEGTENTLTDGAEYVYDDVENEEPNACLFSKADLTVNGSGALTVNANFNHGINTKDGLIVAGGNITVTAKDHGIRGKDYVEVLGGKISVKSDGDGIRAANETDAGLGYVYVTDGEIQITSGGDGIEAVTCMRIDGGSYNLSAGAKGLKASCDMTINGGDFTITSTDDAVHTNYSIMIADGNLEISTGEDGVHANTQLDITGGFINVTKSYEGLEATTINISGGEMHVVSSDDGINAAGGSNATGQTTGNTGGMGGMRPMGGMMNETSGYINMSGGSLYINASGDGIDANTNINQTGGMMVCSGPTNGGNGALDYGSSYTMQGGFLVAAGAVGMVQTISTNSTINCLNITLPQTVTGGTIINVSDADGNRIYTYAPEKQYQSVILAGELLKTGETYIISYSGTCDGSEIDGYYMDGIYSDGTVLAEVTIQSIVTSVSNGMSSGQIGNDWGGMGGMQPGMNQQPDMNQQPGMNEPPGMNQQPGMNEPPN